MAHVTAAGSQPTGRWAAQQHAQITTALEADTGGRCCSRALHTFVRARSKQPDFKPAFAKELQSLKDALRNTVYGQVFEPAVVERMLPVVECRTVQMEEDLEMSGERDGLYVVMDGSMQVVQRPDERERPLQVTIRSGHGLPGDTAIDKLDPYVVVVFGSRQVQTPVAVDAGPDPVWDWSATIPFGFESELEFFVFEHDTFSRHDLLCKGKLGISEFERTGFEGALQLEVPEPDQPGARRYTCPDAIPTSGGSLELSLSWVEEQPSAMCSLSSPLSSASKTLRRLASGEAFMEMPDDGAAASQSLNRSMSLRPLLRHATIKTMAVNTLMRAINAGSQASTVAGPGSKGAPNAREPAPWLEPGYQYGAGCFFGLEEGGGTLRALAPSVLMFVPRQAVRVALQEGREEMRRQQLDFLRRRLPGAQCMEKRAFENFAAAFQSVRFLRGHVLCAKGQAGSAESRRIYVIRTGTCRVLQPEPPPRAGVAPPRPSTAGNSGDGGRGAEGNDRAAAAASGRPSPRHAASAGDLDFLRPPVHAAPIGLLGEGALVGCASSAFGLPEPFTVIADEPVTAVCINVVDRPVTNWPKEVVKALHESIKRQADWHGGRSQLARSVATTSSRLFGDKPTGPPAWTIADSPFLRHKELSSWLTVNVLDRFAEEGWVMPKEAKGTEGQQALTQSCPSLPGLSSGSRDSAASSKRPTSKGPAADVGRPLSAAEVAKRPLAEWSPVKTPGGEGFGSLATPWGTWIPSGELPNARGPRDAPNTVATRARAHRAEKSKERRRSGPAAYRAEPQLHSLNLRCSTDWRKINEMASKTAVAKMYRMQMRSSAAKSQLPA